MLRRLRDESFDVLVIGGGITGAGVALDAASRGLSTALVERDDFASGTSSKSSKLVHGGLRYLQQGEVRLVYEALRERRRLRHNAPHLVKVMPFMIPILGKPGAGEAKSVVSRRIARALGSAMWMYDLTGGWRIGRLHRRLRRTTAFAHLPTMPEGRLVGAYLYFDAAADDARLVLTVLRTAAARGAAVANRCSVVEITHDESGVATGAIVEADGQRFPITARSVVNATGVWSDDVRALDENSHPDSIRPAKGVHITVPWLKVRNDIAVVIPVPRDKRSLFLVPWGRNPDGTFRHTYVGTTDTEYDGPLDQPQCTKDDIDYVLRALRAAITTDISESDITGVWAGLRPLVKASAAMPARAGRTADLSRRHRVSASESGVISVTGGKLTTYRQMAEDTIDAVVEHLGSSVAPSTCRTQRLRLLGADRVEATHLVERYGSVADVIEAIIAADPATAAPLVDGLPYLVAEAVHAVRSEMATTLDDILDRRTRARLLDRDAAVRAAPRLADLMAAELGWSALERARHLRVYVDSCAAEAAAGLIPEAELIASITGGLG